MRRYDLQSGLWMGVLTVLIFGGLYVAADLNATTKSSNTLNIKGEFWSDTGTGFASGNISGRSTKIALGPNANATVSIDLITDSGAGNQTDDGVTSGTVSGQGTKIAVEVFAKGVTTSLVGVRIEFDFDASVLTFDKAENSAFLFIIPEATGASLAGAAPVTLPASGFIGRAEFSTVVDVTGRAFSIGIKAVTLAESAASSDIITTPNAISFNAALSPDFDGDGTVGFSDFLAFAGQYGSNRGDGRYQAQYDLDSDGAISFSDFLIFASSYGTQVPPSGGGGGGGGGSSGSPDLIVESPSVSDNTLTTGQSFTLSATIRNQGTGSSAATTLRYYRSSNSTISRSDTQVGTDSVNGLSASGTSAESISLNAPSSAGTYYYGACVASVSGESDTNNNCSSAVRVTVSRTTSGFAPADQQAFNSRFVGKRIEAESYIFDFESAGRFTESFNRNPGRYTYSNTGANTGTLTLNYDAELRCTIQLTFTSTTTGTISTTCNDRVIFEDQRWQLSSLTTPVFARATADTLFFVFLDTWRAGQTRAYDFQLRQKMPQGSWDSGCVAYPNESGTSVTTYARVWFPGLESSNTTYEMRYRYRNSSSCNTGSPGPWSAIVEGTTIGTGGSSGGTTVTIADANLRAVIADSLGKAHNAPITRAEMATLTRLAAPNKGIRNLTGIEHATNLQSLDLGRVRVNDEWVNSNDISDLSPLSNLTNLRVLILSGNSISDISALSNLTNLTGLSLSDNSISDISALSNLINLTGLGLGGNSISDISALSNLTNLTELYLYNNSISDISALSNLTNLTTWLDLDENNISDISALSNLTNLTELDLGGNSISDISALSNLTNLTGLSLSDNSISDISALSNLTNLRLLYLGGNSISDISVLSNLTNLTDLRLRSNSISDISPLVANTGLGTGDEVDVRNNPLSATSINTHIPALQSRGVDVRFGASKPAVEEKERGIIREEWEAKDYISRGRMAW